MLKRFRENKSFKIRFVSILSKKESSVNTESLVKPVCEELNYKKESLKEAVWKAQEKLNNALRNSLDYQLRVKKLNLNSKVDEKRFLFNTNKAKSIIHELEKDEKSAMERYATITATENNIRASIADISSQIEFMKLRPDSNIDLKYQEIRDEMVTSLGLKREDCFFAGELIDVKKDSKEWQGSIEKAFGDFIYTLIVPKNYYSMVKRWFNIRDEDFNLKITSFDPEDNKEDNSDFQRKSLVNKLIFKDHKYVKYLKNNLYKYYFSCAENSKEMKKTPFSITKNGEIHFNKGKYSADDSQRIDNERMWNLGFSNKNRLNLLELDKKELKNRLLQNLDLAEKARLDLDEIMVEKGEWEKAASYKWDEINASVYIRELKALKCELQSMENFEMEISKPVNRMVLA